MTPHLLAVEIGPVVEMIQAARKTRDLWFGSHVMSDVAKAVAHAIARYIDPVKGHEHLIFPAPASMEDLDSESEFTVADEIWAEIPAGKDPAEAARRAKQAAHQAWLGHASRVRKELGSLIDGDEWGRQAPVALDPSFAGEVVETPTPPGHLSTEAIPWCGNASSACLRAEPTAATSPRPRAKTNAGRSRPSTGPGRPSWRKRPRRIPPPRSGCG